MHNYIALTVIYFYDLMATCNDGDCPKLHYDCWDSYTCFYDNLLQSALIAFDVGWF